MGAMIIFAFLIVLSIGSVLYFSIKERKHARKEA